MKAIGNIEMLQRGILLLCISKLRKKKSYDSARIVANEISGLVPDKVTKYPDILINA